MSSFFEPPPPPERPHEHRRPEWFAPPENVVGVVVPLEMTLARTYDVVVAVRGIDVYPNGLAFHVPLLLRQPISDPSEVMAFHPRRGGLSDDVLRLGVQYADGRKATNLELPFFSVDPEERPPGPVMMPRGGGGGGRYFDLSFWLWPLPGEGPLKLVVEWPTRGIALTRQTVAVGPLLEAATRCEELWPDDDGGDPKQQILVLGGPG